MKDEELSQLVKCSGEEKELEKTEFELRYKNPEYLLWGGHAGYVFLDECDLYVSRYNYTTTREQAYLEVRVEHGENPTNAGYAYAVIPYADKEKLEAYSKSPDVEIISNTSSLQAVRERNLGISGYVFYEAGRAESVETDTPAIVMIGDKDGVIDLSVCDPTQLEESITVRIFGSLKLISADLKIKASEKDGYTELGIDCKGSMSAPFRAKFERV